MKVVEFWTDLDGRKYAVLEVNELKCLAWKSNSKEKWLVAPFTVDRGIGYWVVKGSETEIKQAEIPAHLVETLGLESKTGVHTTDPREDNQLFKKHGLLKGWSPEKVNRGMENALIRTGVPKAEAIAKVARADAHHVISFYFAPHVNRFYSWWNNGQPGTAPPKSKQGKPKWSRRAGRKPARPRSKIRQFRSR